MYFANQQNTAEKLALDSSVIVWENLEISAWRENTRGRFVSHLFFEFYYKRVPGAPVNRSKPANAPINSHVRVQ